MLGNVTVSGYPESVSRNYLGSSQLGLSLVQLPSQHPGMRTCLMGLKSSSAF